MFETKNNKVQVQYWNLINKTVLQFFLSHSFTYSGSDDWCILMSNKIISYMSNVNKTLTWHEPWITDCFTWILISWLIKILGELSTVVWSPMYSKFQGTLVTAKTYMYIYIYASTSIVLSFANPQRKVMHLGSTRDHKPIAGGWETMLGFLFARLA